MYSKAFALSENEIGLLYDISLLYYKIGDNEKSINLLNKIIIDLDNTEKNLFI